MTPNLAAMVSLPCPSSISFLESLELVGGCMASRISFSARLISCVSPSAFHVFDEFAAAKAFFKLNPALGWPVRQIGGDNRHRCERISSGVSEMADTDP
jgi:hypothetical protein